ncbi:MAG: hypothetical protein ACTHU0_10330 [Kofleriaceae bacterium]
MRPIRESVRVVIRRLYFTERRSFEQISERLGVSTQTVRDAIVLDGGARPPRKTGPFHPGE